VRWNRYTGNGQQGILCYIFIIINRAYLPTHSRNFLGVLHLMHHIDDGIWLATVNLPAGTPLDVPIKFAWKVDDIWNWEYLPDYHIHLLLLDPEARTHFAAYRYNTEAMRIEPDEALGVELDAYKKATEYYKGSRNYHYHLAIDLLHKEDLRGSEQAYAAYQKYFPEEAGSSQDDYFTQKMQYLARTGQHERALKEIESKYAQEAQSPRGAYYRYTQGWVLLHADRFEESRQAMRQSMELADDADQYHSQEQYARYGLAMGYMRDPDPEEQRNARWYLLGLVNTHTNQHIRRLGWEQLAHIAENDEDTSLYEQAMDALQHTGSPRQRNRSRIRWAQYLMDHAPADSARIVL
jgi:hypothetical protein